MRALELTDSWPVPHVAAAAVDRDGVIATRGDLDRVFPLASVTKLLTAHAVLLAIEEGVLGLDEPAGPPGATVRHLLAHASGLSFRGPDIQSAPGRRRIYSNAGYAVLGDLVAQRSGFAFADYVREGVTGPLGMARTSLEGHAGHGGLSTAPDIATIARELLAPTLLARETHAQATTVAFPGLNGVLPGYGVQRPNDWGLGPEIRGTKHPHWTGADNSPRTVGHFGQSGTFCWADPEVGIGLVALTDRDFGDWSRPLWPALSDAVLAEWAG
ncbi:MAG: serine hydrolase [Actinobacteria bacterium 69-20]|nr:beta-lactamase family protein [Actinomycetota bacterium]OJV27143.1 MAG: serine hydrolase [Actinobacteria bacterium 69-20]